MSGLTLPSRTPPAAEIEALALSAADINGLPRELMLALCLGESGHGLQSFDRWHRWTADATAALGRGDRQALLDILALCAVAGDQGQGTDDISFGPAHQTWRWSPEYNGQRYDLDSMLRMRARYIEDPGHALQVAANNVGAKWRQHGDVLEALCRYNSPNRPGSQNPNRGNYERALAEAQKRLASVPAPTPGGSMIVYEDFPIPSTRAFRGTPKGIILHGSRSGAAGNPLDREYLGTARWAQQNPDGLGWNATIGEGKVAVHLDPRVWGWNARAASDSYLAVEIAQPTAAHTVTDGQVAALTDWIRTRVLPIWADLPMHFLTHAEVERSGETGQRDGKTDVYPFGDRRADELRARLMAALGKGEAVEQPSTYSVGPGILEAMRTRGDAPASDEVYYPSGAASQYSEAFGRSGSRYVYVFATNTTHRYDPAA